MMPCKRISRAGAAVPARGRRRVPHALPRAVCVVLSAFAFATARGDGLEVELAGVDDELADNVRARLGIVGLAERPEEAAGGRDGRDVDAAADAGLPEARVRRLHDAAPVEIAQALRPFGYYDPEVSSSLERTEDGWAARYEIRPGEPTRIAEIDVSVVGEGREADAVAAVLADRPFASGDALRHADYERFKRRLFEAAYETGYIDARYTEAALRIRPDALEADVRLALDTGERYYFGPLLIEQEILSAEFVDRYVPIEPGDPFDTSRLIDLQLALGDSGYFSDVTVDVLRDESSNRRIPVRVETTPRPNQEFTVGFGYGTDTGPRLRFGAQLRRINRSGHRFRFDTRLSAIEQTATGEYRIPVRNYATDYVSYRGSLGIEEIGDLETEQLTVGGAWNDRWRGMQRQLYVQARREEFGPSGAPTRIERTLFPGAQLSKRRSDDPVLPRRAYSWSADVSGSAEALGSTSFARLHLTAGYIRPLGPRGRFIVHGEYGAIRADDFGALVPSLRFFAGGDQNVRGYEYQSLGPTNADGATIGGRYLAIASVELDYLFVENYGAAVFFDAGGAANDPTPKLSRGAGIGLRWRSPVGMLRVDFAHPLDDPDEDFRLHLSIGASF